MNIRTFITLSLLPIIIKAEYLQKGNLFYEEMSLDSAVVYYNRALENDENRALCYINLGNCYYRKGDYPESATYYRLSIEEAPDFLRPYYNLTIVYYLMDDTPLALATAEKARKLDPENIQTLTVLASLYRDVKAYSSAIILIEKQHHLLKENPQLTSLLYELYRETGDHSRAADVLISVEDTFKDKYILLGQCYTDMNRLSEAESAFLRASRDIREGHYYLVETMIRRKNYHSAVIQAEISLKQFPDFSALALLAAEISMKQKWYEKAELFYLLAYRQNESQALIGLQNLLQLFNNYYSGKRAEALKEKIVNLQR